MPKIDVLKFKVPSNIECLGNIEVDHNKLPCPNAQDHFRVIS